MDHSIIYAKIALPLTTRNGTIVPYIVHPIEAAAIVSSMTDDEEVIAAAVLHDVLEDTEATEDDLYARFGRRITELVINESENKRRTLPAALTWKTRKQDKKMHGWMYRSIAEALRELSEHPVWQEYDRLVRTVFDE